ncbi:RNA-binding protein BRN1-like isoform X2 [Oryza glaberrima]|uniref:RNA-binding protein BRN1-like isoform X2 n=1 Tax=Oryza glaberrima TaxID=4538 RepID=UPI00224C0EB6|nr:RNA-binding protein BRN1-like isoform X2 [Oryza glaberrima]
MAGDGEDGGERVRLFVGQVPRSMAEEDILAVVRAAARADDATVIRDRATGASRGCCFVVCSSREEADKAIAAYHNKCTLPGASRAMQVKYADGELERLAAEQKLFIGMLPRDVKENEVSALFSQYGNIRQLKILRSPQKTRKACAILEFGSKEHARAAIEAFNGTRVVFNGSSATLVVKLADTEKEKQARKAQKAQAQPYKPLRFDLFPQLLSIFGAPQMSYLPPYNVFDYKTEGTTDPELKDLMKMTNDKLEMLVTELKSVVNLLENRVTYNDPIQPIQHSLLPVEHDEKQYKPNECDSKTLEVPGDYGHTKNPLASYNTMYPHVNQGNLLQGLNTNIFPGTDPKISNLIQSAGYIQPHFPDLSGLHYPVSYAGALVGDTPQYFSDGKVNIPNIHSNHASSAANTKIRSKIEGPPRANLFVYNIPQEYGDEDLANLFQEFGRILSTKVFIDRATGVSKCFGFVSYDTPASAQAAIRRMNGSQIGGKMLKVQLKRET